jgi:type II secretory pathway component PulF
LPTYTYSAVDIQGRTRKGSMPAQDESNLEMKLRGAGLWLVDAAPAVYVPPAKDKVAGSEKGWMSWGAPKRRTLIEFCTLMGFQTRVGITLLQALEVARQDCEDNRFRRVLAGLQHHIESGLLFCEALEKYPRSFSPHFISVMRAGETSSKLPDTFDDLRDYLEWPLRFSFSPLLSRSSPRC